MPHNKRAPINTSTYSRIWTFIHGFLLATTGARADAPLAITAPEQCHITAGAVINGAGDTGTPWFNEEKTLVAEILQELQVGPGGSIAGAMQYSNYAASTSFSSNLQQVLSELSKMDQQGGGAHMATALKKYIEKIDQGLIKPTAGRPLVAGLFTTFVDDRAGDVMPLVETLKQKTNGNVKIVCIGIPRGTTAINKALMDQICPAENQLIYDSVAAARADRKNIARKMCDVPLAAPTPLPTRNPTLMPTGRPSRMPTHRVTFVPTTLAPTPKPTHNPTPVPTTLVPTPRPTNNPTHVPTTHVPTTHKPTHKPVTRRPTPLPTSPRPSAAPSKSPTQQPKKSSTAPLKIAGSCVGGAAALAMLYDCYRRRRNRLAELANAAAAARVPLLGDEAPARTPSVDADPETPTFNAGL